MRGHKFLIIVGDATYVREEYDLEADVRRQIKSSEDPYMTVVSCPHEKFEDNIVRLYARHDENQYACFVRDMNGKLWYFEHAMEKLDVIKAFEQTDEENV